MSLLIALLLIGCGQDAPNLEDLQKFNLNNHRGSDKELKFLSMKINKVTPLSAEMSEYNITGTYQYPNDMYKFILNFDGINIFKFNIGSEAKNFNGSVIAGKNKDGWYFTRSDIPFFVFESQDTKLTLINQLHQGDVVEIHPRYGKVLLLDYEFQSKINIFIERYDTAVSQLAELNNELKTIKDEYNKLSTQARRDREDARLKLIRAWREENDKMRKDHYSNFDEYFNTLAKDIIQQREMLVTKIYHLKREVESRKNADRYNELKSERDQLLLEYDKVVKLRDQMNKDAHKKYSDDFNVKAAPLKKILDADILANDKAFNLLEIIALDEELKKIEKQIKSLKDNTIMFYNARRICDNQLISQSQCKKIEEIGNRNQLN